jgi:hypothetical protein
MQGRGSVSMAISFLRDVRVKGFRGVVHAVLPRPLDPSIAEKRHLRICTILPQAMRFSSLRQLRRAAPQHPSCARPFTSRSGLHRAFQGKLLDPTARMSLIVEQKATPCSCARRRRCAMADS